MKECLVAAEIGQFVPDDRLQRLLRLVHHSMGIRNLFSRSGIGQRGRFVFFVALRSDKVYPSCWIRPSQPALNLCRPSRRFPRVLVVTYTRQASSGPRIALMPPFRQSISLERQGYFSAPQKFCSTRTPTCEFLDPSQLAAFQLASLLPV